LVAAASGITHTGVVLQLPDRVVVREINFDNVHWLAK
jgi:hypothetical protein